jgi:endonuclease/exonuclease/phosphatase family metal-dependent hydrolase
LESLAPDVALLQESYPPSGGGAIGGEIGGRRNWGSWIVPYGNVTLTAIPTVPLTNEGPGEGGALEASHPGAFAAADAHLDERRTVTLVSLYGMLAFKGRNSTRYAVTTVHRALSDLTPILDIRRTPAPVVLAGDLNVSPQIAYPDTAAHEAVIQRIEAFGLENCLGAKHDGQFVRTFGTPQAPFQDDWVFSSPALVCTRCEAVDADEAWALSDHCPVLAEFEFA